MIVLAPVIKALLLESADVKTLVGSRVYPDVMPATSASTFPGPTLVMTTWPITAQQGSDGPTGWEAHRVQLDAYALTRAAADEVMATAAGALCPRKPASHHRAVGNVTVQAVMETPTPGAPTHEKETNLYRRSLDFKVHAAMAA